MPRLAPFFAALAFAFAFSWAGTALAGPTAELAEDAPMRTVVAARTDEKMKIDGRADEAVWERAEVQGDFVERKPALRGTPAYDTNFQVAYDANNLYVFVRAQMPAEAITLRTLQRDNFNIFADSSIGVKIDPHHDRRTVVILGFNSAGAQIDVLSLEDGRNIVLQWDAVWDAEVRVHPEGFDGEVKIPFAILGIKGGEEVRMGFDITRDEPSLNATYDWRLFVPPRSPFSASPLGTLAGLHDIEAQRAFELTPFVAGATDFSPIFRLDPRRRANLSTGTDARVQVGAGSYVEATVLTDFAQVEADAVQVANDRFPLFFPERRPFFINGLDVFNFGLPSEAQLFFSRRVGLDAGRAIPIAAGVKSYGHSGKLSYGLLNVQTLRTLPRDGEFAEDEGTPPENVSVARLRLQTGPFASVGMIASGKHRFGEAAHDNFSTGVDAEIRALAGKLRSYAFVASSYAQHPFTEAQVSADGEIVARPRPAEERTGTSASASVEYQGLYLRPFARWLWSSADFEAPLGFYRRPGTATQSAGVLLAPRPVALGLQEVRFGPDAFVTTSPDYDELLTAGFGNVISPVWRNGWEFRYFVGYLDDQVQQPFTLYGHPIEADVYRSTVHALKLETPRQRALSGSAEYLYDQRFGGVTHSAVASVNLRATRHFALNARYEHRLGHLRADGSDFDFGFLNGSMLFAFTRNLFWDTLVRFSLEPGAERLGLQSRLRWRYRPGSDIFLVYRSDLPIEDAAALPDARAFHALTLKVTFYLRALLKR